MARSSTTTQRRDIHPHRYSPVARQSLNPGPHSTTTFPLQRHSLCKRSTPLGPKPGGVFHLWLADFSRCGSPDFSHFWPFPDLSSLPLRTCRVKSPQDHPYTNQRVTGKVRQGVFLSIGRALLDLAPKSTDVQWDVDWKDGQDFGLTELKIENSMFVPAQRETTNV